MANQNDSFIDEVTEELRRDRMYATFRRYGWIGIAAILLVVGGAAWFEYQKSREQANAQAFGDAVLAAEQAADQPAALAQVDTAGSPRRAALTGLLAAGAQADAGQDTAAAAQLEQVATALGQNDAALRDLARLKLVLVQGEAMDPATRDALLADLARPGAPFELLALEQQAVALIGAGRIDDAAVLIGQIQQRDGLSETLRRRLSETMIALGVEPDPAQSDAPTMN
ncbi:MAG: tetratricopeptide repeat protein [Paracoccus sp. (in: a-proteobacteria)]|nr:tetratricopeptide repeat protein [Paracoccus sp. (in: a-proteobacteria)]